MGYTCDDIEIRPGELDIKVPKSTLLNDPNRSACQIASVEIQYDWAKQFNQLQFLCRGCLDPFCDRDFLLDNDLCPMDSMSHDEDDKVFAETMVETVRALGTTQVNAVTVCAVAVAAMAMWAAKQCLW